MKGTPDRQAAVYHTFNVEDLIEAGHPLRPITRIGRACRNLSGDAGTDPPRGRRRAKPKRAFPAEVLSPDEALRLIEAIKGPAAMAARNRAINGATQTTTQQASELRRIGQQPSIGQVA